ncbi:MAG: response regulator [Gammaproteobacteria bacterium]
MTEASRLLIADDEPHNLELLQLMLERENYLVDTAGDGSVAWEKISASPEKYDVVLLDRMMPKLTGMEVLQKMKSDARLRQLPVVLQTALSSNEDVTAGIEAGAYYYLGKPYERSILHSVVAAAANDYKQHRQLIQDLQSTQQALSMLDSGEFSFSTLDEAHALAILLANGCTSGPSIVSGLAELLVNAVEHGNLGITYAEKSALLADNSWRAEIDRRLSMPEFAQRRVKVSYHKTLTSMTFLIEDEGDGLTFPQ